MWGSVGKRWCQNRLAAPPQPAVIASDPNNADKNILKNNDMIRLNDLSGQIWEWVGGILLPYH